MIGIALVISTLWLFRVFDIIFVMTGGGPSGATETLAIQIYREAFQYFQMSYAAAVGMITLAALRHRDHRLPPTDVQVVLLAAARDPLEVPSPCTDRVA